MPSFNLVFHVSSALAFAALIYWILRLQAERRFHERLWMPLAGSEPQPVMLDWPQRFLERLSRAWGLSLSGEELQAGPQRIDVQMWVRCHCALGMQAIARGPGLHLSIRVARADADGKWQPLLEKSLGGRFAIELRT